MPQVRLSSQDISLMRTVLASTIKRYNEAVIELRKNPADNEIVIADIEAQNQRLRMIEQKLINTGLT